MVQNKNVTSEDAGFHRSFKVQNPFNSEDYNKPDSHLHESNLHLDCPPRPDMTLSQLACDSGLMPSTVPVCTMSLISCPPPSIDMPASQPINIPDAKKRTKKKKRCRATDSFTGRFQGKSLENHPLSIQGM
ncbi:unnamed protein product [Coregonus sp. 'balchen']|nr:unnamed protein product [Coregonus sp. 'balchen']